MPIERMLRTIWPGDSSNAKYRHRSPRRQAASTKLAARLRLAGARRPGDQDAAAAVVALAAEHGVQARDAGGDPLGGDCVLQPQRRDRAGREMPSSSIRNGYSLVPCAEPRYLTTRSRRVEICSCDPVVQQDDAVGDVFLQAVAGERALAALAGDDGRDALVLEPAEQPAQLGAQDAGVGQAGEQRLDGVQHDPLGADGVDRRRPGG